MEVYRVYNVYANIKEAAFISLVDPTASGMQPRDVFINTGFDDVKSHSWNTGSIVFPIDYCDIQTVGKSQWYRGSLVAS